MSALIDRQLIWDCLLRYCRGIDRLDLDLIRSAFWEDGIDAHGPVDGSVNDFLALWLPAQPNRDVCFHMVSNQSVEINGYGADAEAYFMAATKLKGQDELELIGGRYVDRYEKREGEWRIKTRVMVLDWQGVMDASAMPARMAKRHNGSRDRDDASYERPVQPRKAIATEKW
ncbi:nuclear transport factor 2 family protein [Streptomyces sp. 5-6(2022)]|uniref:nuclear transport factor 2 family protein n=1 Tax=Streptomyces sp. 5-6(2022) TaxID=2936510 RepID=UPI0023B9D215|nr:nuclear transport factor 2 family protein [Streptomyces sp. 5-6(2022)]